MIDEAIRSVIQLDRRIKPRLVLRNQSAAINRRARSARSTIYERGDPPGM